MATSGYKDVSVANYITLRYSWTAGTQNVASNYTPVSWKLQLISSNSSANINSSASKDYSVTTDGSKKTGTNTVGLSGGATKTLASGSKNIYHNSDGTKTFSYSFSQEFAITYSGDSVGTISGSGTGTLNTIPRKSTLGTISNFTIGDAINIPITKYSSGFSDTLVIKLGSFTKTITGINNGYDVSFTTAELTEIYKQLPSATKGTFTFTLTTKSGTTTIGSASKTAVGTINANIKPSISSIALSEAEAGINAQFGAYIQGQSKIKGTITAAAGNGSSIASYKTVINGNTYTASTFTTAVLKTVGSNTVSVTVTDKRGRTATSSTTFNVLAYASPKITTFTVIRCLADGTEDVEGEYVKINVNSSITAVNNKNVKSFKLEYKKKTDTTWTTLAAYTEGYTYTLTNSVYPNFSGNSPYNFRLTAVDFFHSATKLASISTAYAIMDLKNDGTGIAFGKVSTEADTFDVGFKKTNLSTDVYVGGTGDLEKNVHFKTPDNAPQPSHCKVYGGTPDSATGIGMWDVGNARQIYSYFPAANRLQFGADMSLTKGGYPIIHQLTRTSSHNTGTFHYSNGLLIQHGVASITPTAANTSTGAVIKFPLAYTYRPSVFAEVQTSSPDLLSVSVGQGSASLGDFTIFVIRPNTQATTVHWVAIGYKEG